MQKTNFKIYVGLIVMILFLVIPLFIKELMISELGAALSIIIGANTYRQLAFQKNK
jgi:hypothetical protein